VRKDSLSPREGEREGRGRGWERERRKGRGGREGERRLAPHTIFRPWSFVVTLTSKTSSIHLGN